MASFAAPLSGAAAARVRGPPAEAAPPSAQQRFPILCVTQEVRLLRLYRCSSPGLKSRRILPKIRAMDMSAGQSDSPEKISLNSVTNSLNDLWARCPESVRNFPWMRASRHFLDLIFDLVLTVAKYLCIPVLLVSSLSEISYCAHERRMFAIPVPFLCGVVIAKVMEETFVEISPAFKDMDFPWHLMLTAGFFMLVKLPGPYYPYLGRLVLPHFANGALCSTIWSIFSWFRRPRLQITEK